MQHLSALLDRQDSITAERYVVPYAYYELGMLHMKEDAAVARRYWRAALAYKHDYNFEMRLHLRIHLAFDQLAAAAQPRDAHGAKGSVHDTPADA